MARRRMISPSLWEDEHFGQLSDKAKILFIACISNADDEGRLNANPSNLRALAFRYEELTIAEIKELLHEVSNGLKNFTLYEVDGSQYIQLMKWEKHQIIRSDRIKPSDIPPCQPDDNQVSTKCRRSIVKSSIVKSKEKDTSKMTLEDFNLFWKEYPLKKKRSVAEKKFLSLKRTLLPLILSKLALFKKSDDWTKDNGKFIPHPTSWINQKRWEDEIEVKKVQYDPL